MFDKINSMTEKYRVDKNENLGSYNLNTFFTFDNVFDVVANYLKYKTESFLGRPLLDIEFPDRDKTHQLINSSDKQLADKTVLPRAIMLYEMNPMDDELVDIPTLNTHFDMNNGLVMELFGIRKSRLSSSVIKELDVYRDIDVSLFGNMSFTSALIFFTVLVDNRVEAIELQKQFKTNFPIENLHDIYKFVVNTDDTSGCENNSGVRTRELELIPHSFKTVIPDDIVEKLKESFSIKDRPNSDNLLESILKTYSYNYITREVDGSSQKAIWTTTYSCIPIIVPKNIQNSNNVKNMKETSAVRIEFQLSYIEIKAYKLRTKYKVLSAENPSNYIENVNVESRLPSIGVETLKVAPILGDCSRYADLKLAYESEDFKNNEMSIYIPDLLETRDKYLPKYIKYLSESTIEEDHKFYKIIVKHASNQTADVNVESSNGTYYSYDDLCIYDNISNIGDKIYLIVYINNEEYKKWKFKMGFEDIGNLSSKFLKR